MPSDPVARQGKPTQFRIDVDGRSELVDELEFHLDKPYVLKLVMRALPNGTRAVEVHLHPPEAPAPQGRAHFGAVGD